MNSATAMRWSSFHKSWRTSAICQSPPTIRPNLSSANCQTYRVEGAFPRLVRAELPNGVMRISYEIELEAIKDFETDDDEVLKEG